MSPEMTQETVILSGFPVLLDAEDLPLIASHNWDIRDNGRGQKYVSGSIAGKSEYLHRKIMGARDARWAGRFDRAVKPDSGAFMLAVAGIIPPPDAHVSALGRFTGQRPDARAL